MYYEDIMKIKDVLVEESSTEKFLRETKIKKYKVRVFYKDLNFSASVHIDPSVRDTLPVKFGHVQGSFFCNYNQLTSLEGAPESVGKNFSCSNNQLTSLEGAPESVGKNFSCSNNQITSLEGAPSFVGGDFNCNSNQLTSLEGIHEKITHIGGELDATDNKITKSVLGVLLISGIKKIILDNKEVEMILNRHLGQGKQGLIKAQRELIDAGLDEYAEM